MTILNKIEKGEIRDLLGRGWLTHDGMWFYHTAKMLGVKVLTNSLVGCKYEDWFKKDRKELVEYIKAFKKEKIDFLISEL